MGLSEDHHQVSVPDQNAHNVQDKPTNGPRNAEPQEVHDASQDRITCQRDGCANKAFGTVDYERHLIEEHGYWPCRVCRVMLSSNSNYNNHISTVHGDGDELGLVCPYPGCGKRYPTLRYHQLSHTNSYKEKRCRKCGDSFQTKRGVRNHLWVCLHELRAENGIIDDSQLWPPNTAEKAQIQVRED